MAAKTDLALKIPLADPLFYSLQGEGATLGRPSVFVRLMGCTVGCAWCDTKYSWAGPPVLELSLEDILAYCRERPGAQVIVTGGEPLESEFLLPLLVALKEAGLRTEIETSGYIPPADAIARLADQWNVSPKLQSANIPENKQPVTLGWLHEVKEPYLKFVLHKVEEFEEVESLLEKYDLSDFPRERIIISPGGKKMEHMEKRLRPLAEEALRRGYRFTPRLHVLLWGDKRGV
ncbi:MAG: 7-carboxy-7-deazaguanine synthase QueE [bacterium]|nr:7-carboxy-7-deazaguanine synthase QueE [bacterium]